MFVRIVNHECAAWGIGKVEHIEEDLAQVEFFDSPVTKSTSVDLSINYLNSIQLPRQTRVYWQDEETSAWLVGRVLYDDGKEVLVRFPNKVDRRLSSHELYVRWDRPIVDPTAYLAYRINETPCFAQARSNFVEALTAQRAACQGMTALISSIIDLEPHQIEVIRRVLQDPVQRYLLADEVGLGKTIEAGVLIRQYVLDDPSGHKIVVLVPPALITQWHNELAHRFLLDVDLDDSIEVVSMSESITNLDSLIKDAGMLVIDEAHHMSRNRLLYDSLQEVITKVPRLLLLSATPVLHNERGFLEMLHLLDPHVYPLEHEEAFKQRIEHRQMLAETVAGLVPENLLQLDLFLDELVDRFQQDDLLKQHVDRLREIVDGFPEETDQQYLQSLNELRAHLSETYRLDRRILRNRRSRVPGLTPTRICATFIDYSSNRSRSLVMAIESWRSHIAAEIYGSEDTSEGLRVANWFSDLLASSLTDPECVMELVHARIDLLQKNRGGAIVHVSSELPLLSVILNAAQELVTDSDRYVALVKYLELEGGNKTKFVIFCTGVGIADRVTAYLEQHQVGMVDRHTEIIEDDMEVFPWRGFLDDPKHRILVCDAHAEEGLNLQGGDKAIVHFDLPLAPNRIEQRMGRIDRYGSGSAIRSLALRCIDNFFEVAWASCLDKGLGVFRHSIASLQYLIENEMHRLSRTLLIDGLEAIVELTNSMGGENGLVEKELRRINDQDALDALMVPPEETLDTLFDVDSDWRSFSESVDKWLIDTLRMGKVNGPNVGRIPDTVYRLHMRYANNGPDTLIPLKKFLDHFMSTLDFEAPQATSRNLLTFPYTCRRETALRRGSLEHKVRLLRLGEPFLDGLVALTSLDDRGRSVAMWRHIPGYEAQEKADIFIRFDFIVETDIEKALKYYTDIDSEVEKNARTAMTRRGDMSFPPFFQSIWLDGALNLVEGKKQLELLTSFYNIDDSKKGYIDKSLNQKCWQDVVELGLPVIDYWSEWLAQARETADVVLRQHVSLEDRSNIAVKRARVIDSSRFAQLQTRISRSSGTEAETQRQFLGLEQSAANALYAGILSPRITLNTISAVFVSGEPLLPSKKATQGHMVRSN